MIYLLCFVGCVLTYLCYMSKRDAREAGDTKTFRYIFVTNSLEFLIPFTAVALFYIAIAISLRGMESDETTLETLRLYENRLLWLKETLKLLKLTTGYSLLLLLGCFLLSLVAQYLALPDKYSERINKSYQFFEKYNKWLKRISITVALLASFTFFGGQASMPTNRLEARIKSMVDEYNGFRDALDEVVSESLLNETYIRLASSTAPRYQQWSKVNDDFKIKYVSLEERYDLARRSYKVVAPKAEALAGKPPQRQAKINDLLPESDTVGRKPPRTASPPPDQARFISNQKLKGLRASLKEYSRNLTLQTEAALHTPLGSRLVPSGLKAIFNHKNLPLLKTLGEQYPILDAILPVFTDTFNKKTGEGISHLSSQLVNKAMTSPAINLEGEIATGVKEILKDTPVEWSKASGEAFSRIEAGIQQDIVVIEAAKSELDALLKIKEAEIRNQNRQLYGEVRRHWEEAVRNYKPNPPLSERGSLFRPVKAIQRRVMKDAINKFIAETQRITEPIAQNEVLRSTLDLLQSRHGFDYKVSELRDIAQTRLPGTVAFNNLTRIESAIRPELRFRPPTQYPFSYPPHMFSPGRTPPGYRPPTVYRPPPVYKPPTVYRPPRIWFRR